MLIPPDNFILPFIRKQQLAPDVWSFYFDRSQVLNYNFLPGQYNRVTISTVQNDPRGNSRLFSIASSPFEKDHLMITTRISPSPFKQTLLSLPEGTQVDFFGPVGRFTLDEDDTRRHILLAGGIGITPLHSMILYAKEKHFFFPITLFVSFSTVEEIVFYEELTKASLDSSNIKVIYTISRPAESQKSWTGETGRISSDLIKKYCPDFMNSLYYVSGPPAMVDAMLMMVSEMGVSDEQVKKEKFTGY